MRRRRHRRSLPCTSAFALARQRRPLAADCSRCVRRRCVARRSAAGEFPYVAYVVEPDTYVRSGPGREHYPTGQLPAGYAVEVYRHDGAGWCAIRPPEGSFSLAPLHQLRIVDERTAEVTADGVVARVGSVARRSAQRRAGDARARRTGRAARAAVADESVGPHRAAGGRVPLDRRAAAVAHAADRVGRRSRASGGWQSHPLSRSPRRRRRACDAAEPADDAIDVGRRLRAPDSRAVASPRRCSPQRPTPPGSRCRRQRPA